MLREQLLLPALCSPGEQKLPLEGKKCGKKREKNELRKVVMLLKGAQQVLGQHSRAGTGASPAKSPPRPQI